MLVVSFRRRGFIEGVKWVRWEEKALEWSTKARNRQVGEAGTIFA